MIDILIFFDIYKVFLLPSMISMWTSLLFNDAASHLPCPCLYFPTAPVILAPFTEPASYSHDVLTISPSSITVFRHILCSHSLPPLCTCAVLSTATPLFAAVWNFPSAAVLRLEVMLEKEMKRKQAVWVLFETKKKRDWAIEGKDPSQHF